MKIAPSPAQGAFAVVLAALGSAPLAAGTASGPMTVSVVVDEFCRIDARPMIFGSGPSEHGQIAARSLLILACTPAASYAVTIGQDAGDTRRWGRTDANAVSAPVPASGHVELAVYARLAAGQIPTGGYIDTVTVTVAF